MGVILTVVENDTNRKDVCSTVVEDIRKIWKTTVCYSGLLRFQFGDVNCVDPCNVWHTQLSLQDVVPRVEGMENVRPLRLNLYVMKEEQKAFATFTLNQHEEVKSKVQTTLAKKDRQLFCAGLYSVHNGVPGELQFDKKEPIKKYMDVRVLLFFFFG